MDKRNFAATRQLIQFAAWVDATVRDALKSEALNVPRYELLEYLSEVGICDNEQLRDVFGYDASTLVRMLDSLQKKGLISREKGGDRRKKIVRATEKGKAVVERIQIGYCRELSEVLSHLADKVRSKFALALNEIVKNVGGSRFDDLGLSPLYRYPRTSVPSVAKDHKAQ